MSGNLQGGSGNLYYAITIAGLIAIGLFATTNVWTGQQSFNNLNLPYANLTASTHKVTFPTNSGTLCLSNQTGSCGSTAQSAVHAVIGAASITTNGTTGTVALSASVHGVVAGSNITVNGTTGTISVASTAAGGNPTINNYTRSTFTTLANLTSSNPINGHRQFFPNNQTGVFCLRNQTGTCGTYGFSYSTNSTFGQGNGNQTGTSSTISTMDGAYATITPNLTGRLEVTVSGYITGGASCSTGTQDMRFSTSFLGNNGATLAGTRLGPGIQDSPNASTGAGEPFSISALLTGQTVGTKLFFDMSQSGNGATCTLKNVYWKIKEW